MGDSEVVVIGRIEGVYGVGGWVRIRSYTEPEENLLGYGNCKVRRREDWRDIAIDAGRRHGKGLIAHIAGVDDRTTAESLRGSDIAVEVGELPPLGGDEYYWYQLEGLSVRCAGGLLGRVNRLMKTGSNDVLVVEPCRGSRDRRERLIPWLRDSVVMSVDLDAGAIEVDWDPEF